MVRMTKEYRMSFTEKAQEIVNKMTLEQKVWLMSGNIDTQKMSPEELELFFVDMLGTDEKHYNYIPYIAGGIEEYDLPAVRFVDGPRGVVCGNGQTTCFPVSMARGATFSPELEEKVGQCIAKEVKAFGGNFFGGVCINLPYHPGWGRSQETYGEESFHIGKMGSALVKGVQEEGVIACIKHFAFNSMENARFKCSVTCDQRTEKEVFLPHFKECIDAGAASVMSAYNRYNGVHCGHHQYLLQQVLKEEWDFDGFVMSDFVWGVRDTIEAANSGQDIEMMWTEQFGERLIAAVKDGFVSEEKVNQAALRIIRTLLAFSHIDKTYDMSVAACNEHIALAKEVAEKSITLVKNNHILPFDKKTIKKIAVIGKLATVGNIGDHGSSWVRPPYVVTPEEGLRKVCPNCEIIINNGADLDKAKEIAAEVDAVVFVVGYNHNDEGEFISENEEDNYTGATGGDRKKSLELHEDESILLKEVGNINPRSAVVLIGGNMIMMTEWFDQVNAVLMAYYPGMEGGTAIAEILFGDVNPSGKLPFVVPYSEKDLPYVDWEAKDQYYEYYHGYTRLEKHDIEPLIPYGYGLSYTTFEIGTPDAVLEGDHIRVSAEIENTGVLAGEEVLQVYIGHEKSAVDRPKKELRGFCRTHLEPGEKKSVSITIPLEKLKWYDPTCRQWKLEKTEYTIYVGNSSSKKDLKKTKINL